MLSEFDVNPHHRRWFEMIEITLLTKSDGPLTKRISLSPEGELISDASACVMSRGSAGRVRLECLDDLGSLIQGLGSHEAIALGALRPELADQVEVTTKHKLNEQNGTAQPGVISRTGNHLHFRPKQPALALLDFDDKGMPPEVAARVADLGGFWAALVSVLPELRGVGRVMRASTSAGIFRKDTGEKLRGSNGVHAYITVADGTDINRFLSVLHARCRLKGLGWMMVGASGQLLERAVLDRMVGAPQRLVFEGAPVLEPLLGQDPFGRCPILSEGTILDTATSCPPLTILEQANLRDLGAKESARLSSEAAERRRQFVARQALRLADRTGMSQHEAARVIERQCSGILRPDVELPFDDEELAGTTVAHVLGDPARFEGATLADPLEGIEYGRCKARIMRRSDGTPWIHSFAHGRTAYELRYDGRAAKAIVGAAPAEMAAEVFVQTSLAGDFGAEALEELVEFTAQRTGIGKRTLAAKLKAARNEQRGHLAREDRERRTAERQDPRPLIQAPASDAPWLPQMELLNEVLGNSSDIEPPMRDIEGFVTQVDVRKVPNMHALTSEGVNDCHPEQERLPPPDQPVLTRLDEFQLAEMIERHIYYVDERDRPVHLGGAFVKHFHRRTDNALPVVVAISTLPLVLPGGRLLSQPGLDREHGIVFRVPPELLALMPAWEDCGPSAVAAAMQFLTDEWLCDVATDYTGKCILVAAALTVIERSLLPERPVFFVTAGRRGGGKTTTLNMLLTGVTGFRPSAAAFSPNDEERRKTLLPLLMQGLPTVVWDNIPRGAQISCPHIERCCTAASYADRQLGLSKVVEVAAAIIHFLTGNNIGPRGDLASRSLKLQLSVDRADPENRPFRHPDPIAWTEAHRGKILQALYTVLLGGLGANVESPPRTRFKTWWHLVGSPVERAARMVGGTLDFQSLFLAQEEDDEETASLADFLIALAGIRPNDSLRAAELARVINDNSEYRLDSEKERSAILREFLFSRVPPHQVVTAKAVGKRLSKHVGNPVRLGAQTLVLKEWPDPNAGPKGALLYRVMIS